MRLEKRVSLILVPIISLLIATMSTGAWLSMYQHTKTYEIEHSEIALKKALVEVNQLATQLRAAYEKFEESNQSIHHLISDNEHLRAMALNDIVDFVPILKDQITGFDSLIVLDKNLDPVLSFDMHSQSGYTQKTALIPHDLQVEINSVHNFMLENVSSVAASLRQYNGGHQMIAAHVYSPGAGSTSSMKWTMERFIFVISAFMPEITNGIEANAFVFGSSQIADLEDLNIAAEVENLSDQDGGTVLSAQIPLVHLTKEITPGSLMLEMKNFSLALFATTLFSISCIYLVVVKILNRQILFPIKQLAHKVDESVKSGHLDIVPGDESNEVNALGNRYLKLMDQITELANLDPLTHLPNRTQFARNLSQALERSPDKRFALFYFDLDRFKQINDFYGHAQGDRLLSHFARSIESAIYEYSQEGTSLKSQLSRLAGDEFALFFSEDQISVDPEHFAEILIEKISPGIEIGRGRLSIGASTGIAFYPDHAYNANDLLARADEAMLEAKKLGRNRWEILSEDTIQRNNLIKFTQEALEQSLVEKQFYLMYQPILDTTSNEIVGAELLIRSKNSILKKMGTEAYISIAEINGSIHRIDKLVFERALKSLKKIQEIQPDLRFAINISAMELISPEFTDSLELAISRTTISPNSIDLEVTETSLTEFGSQVTNNLKRLHEMGFSLSLDDFGTGYNSFTQLSSGYINRLKIDKTFVAGIHDESRGSNMIDVVLGTSKLLGLETIGEGVETVEQLEYLKSKGCEYYQGYYAYAPMLWEDFYELIEENSSEKKKKFEENPCEEKPLKKKQTA